MAGVQPRDPPPLPAGSLPPSVGGRGLRDQGRGAETLGRAQHGSEEDFFLCWSRPLRSVPRLCFISLVTPAPPPNDPARASCVLGKGIFMQGREAARECGDCTPLIAGNDSGRAGSRDLSGPRCLADSVRHSLGHRAPAQRQAPARLGEPAHPGCPSQRLRDGDNHQSRADLGSHCHRCAGEFCRRNRCMASCWVAPSVPGGPRCRRAGEGEGPPSGERQVWASAGARCQ